jgi:uncharacterized protein YodC (DUF2158 family)
MPSHAAVADPAAPLGVGDVVRLNSDAVRMTVQRVADGKIVCRWHDDAAVLFEDDFDPRELTLVRKREAS